MSNQRNRQIGAGRNSAAWRGTAGLGVSNRVRRQLRADRDTAGMIRSSSRPLEHRPRNHLAMSGTFWQKATRCRRDPHWTSGRDFGIAISMAFVSSMIIAGPFDKFPGLRVVITEGRFWGCRIQGARRPDMMSHPGPSSSRRRASFHPARTCGQTAASISSNIQLLQHAGLFPRDEPGIAVYCTTASAPFVMAMCRGEGLADIPRLAARHVRPRFNGCQRRDLGGGGRRKILAENAPGPGSGA